MPMLQDAVLDAEPLVSPTELHHCIERGTNQRIDDLQVECIGGHVILTGRCPSYYVKQLATLAVLSAEPHVSLQNEIAVR